MSRKEKKAVAKTSANISVNYRIDGGLFSEIGSLLQGALTSFFGFEGVDPRLLKVAFPPDPKMGDFAFSCFEAAKMSQKKPAEFAASMAAALNEKIKQRNRPSVISRAEAAGPYVNLFLDWHIASGLILDKIIAEGADFGRSNFLGAKTIMVEYLAPNTNKPLHIGHARNGVIGTCMANLLSSCGATVIRANNINDRGIHIIKSMLAYAKYGNGQTPASTGEKGDHFVGRFYVMYNADEARLESQWLESHGIAPDKLDKETKRKVRGDFERDCQLVQQSYEMLRRWEAGDPELLALWEKMNGWVYAGFSETNSRLGFTFEKVYYESRTYKLGKDIIASQLQQGIGQEGEGESVLIDLTDAKIGKQPILLIRQDGTSVYMTQDIGLAATRFAEIPSLTNVIYVVAKEQDFHFKTLFEILRRYGYPWHAGLYHLSYGMVNLPEGKMKSREGTVVDVDDLLDQLQALASEVIAKNESDATPKQVSARAEAIAIGALKYMLASVPPSRDIMFDPKESISFEGNTGPYLQYACVRIAAIEDKAKGLPFGDASHREFCQEETELAKKLALFGDALLHAAQDYDPSALAAYLHEVAQAFSAFYANCQVVYGGRVDALRLKLCSATKQVLSNGLKLLGIPVPDRM